MAKAVPASAPKPKAKSARGNDALIARVRAALAHAPRVEEKKAFGGRMFMVRGKMCVTVRDDRIMVRVDPADHDSLVARPGCSTMTMKGRSYRGYIRVDGAALKQKKALDRWVAIALAYNRAIGDDDE